MADDTIYFGDTAGFMYAVDENGALKWKTSLGYEVFTTPAITEDFIYIATGVGFGGLTPGAKIFALKRSDGSVAWSQSVSPISGTIPNVNDGTGDLTVAGDYIIVGISNTENYLNPSLDFKSQGFVLALDRHTGKQLWRFDTTSDQLVDHPKYGGGSGVWSSPGVDLQRGIVYIGVGQSFETPVSPYSDSLLALDIKTGKLLWMSQMNLHDVWGFITPAGPDYDVNTHVNLFNVPIEGKGNVDFVGVGDKSGRYYILKRDPDYDKVEKSKVVSIDSILYLDQASTVGTIQATPTIDDTNNILYVSSDALYGLNGFRVTLNALGLDCFLTDIFCEQPKVTPKVAAYDLNALLNGVHPLNALLWENKDPVSSDPTNIGESFGPLTLSNDVIFTTNGGGYVRILKASDGSLISSTLPLGIPLPIFGGVTIVGKQIFVPTLGGIASYKLP